VACGTPADRRPDRLRVGRQWLIGEVRIVVDHTVSLVKGIFDRAEWRVVLVFGFL